MTSVPDPGQPTRHFTAAGLRRGLIAGYPFIISNGIAGILMGLVYHNMGFSWVEGVAFSALVYSGAAQAVTAGLWASPPPVGPMMLAALVISARYLVMGAQLHQLFPTARARLMLPTLFILADASWLMTMAEAARGRRDAGFLLGASLAMALGWIGGTAIGCTALVVPPGPLAAAAAFIPIGFVVALIPTQWKGRATLLPWGATAAVAALASLFLPVSWAMLAGGGAGTALAAALGHEA
ncbi:MAG: AzlC family ABC transporter permease [Alphaproteobacteria bacterium]